MKNKIYYTEDIIDELSKKGYDEKLITLFVKFYADYLKKYILDTDDISIYIPNFGTLYLTVSGANYSIDRLQKEIDRCVRRKKKEDIIQDLNKKMGSLKSKRKKISQYISNLEDIGVKKIAYYDKIFSSKQIKNA